MAILQELWICKRHHPGGYGKAQALIAARGGKNKGVDSDDLNNRIENQFVKSESENNNSLHNENESNSYQNENESNNQENLSNSNLTRNNRDYDESDFEDESRFSLSSFDSYNSQNYAEIHNHSRNR